MPLRMTAEIQKHACADLLLVFSLNQKTSVHTVACLMKAQSATLLVTEPSKDSQHVDGAEQARVRTHLTRRTHRLIERIARSSLRLLGFLISVYRGL